LRPVGTLPAVRTSRILLLVATGSILAITAAFWISVPIFQATWLERSFAVDYGIYMDAVDRWLRDGTWYPDRQLHGPYTIELGDVLYPPALLYLLVPFRWLGPYLWSAIPAIVLAAVVVRQRPALWGWLLIGMCLAWPYSVAKLIFGNPVIWGAAVVGLATLFRWPAALLVVKPTVIPFAVIGIRDRRWWICLGVLAALSIPFLADTLRYPQVLLDAQTNPIDGRGGPLYSLQEYPLLLVPIVAWISRWGRGFKVVVADAQTSFRRHFT
jgi:hypothetical protein